MNNARQDASGFRTGRFVITFMIIAALAWMGRQRNETHYSSNPSAQIGYEIGWWIGVLLISLVVYWITSLLMKIGRKKAQLPVLTAERIETTPEELIVYLQGKAIHLPWAQCSPKLATASEKERMEAKLSPGGSGIYWPLINEDLSVNGLARLAEAG